MQSFNRLKLESMQISEDGGGLSKDPFSWSGAPKRHYVKAPNDRLEAFENSVTAESDPGTGGPRFSSPGRFYTTVQDLHAIKMLNGSRRETGDGKD